jgi:hypothetical protein
MDHEHQLQVSCAESGVAVVLHHSGNCAHYHHGLAANLLTLLASTDDPTDPDHIIHFAAQIVSVKCSEVTSPAPLISESVALSPSNDSLNGGFLSRAPNPAFWHPPSEHGRASCVRTTLLLI